MRLALPILGAEDLSDVLTNSRLKTARRCLRLHELMYLLGYRPAFEAEELLFGQLWHRGLEAWWLAAKEGATDTRLDAALEAVQAEANQFDRARAEVLLIGYHTRWTDEPYEVISVEERFLGPLVNPETGAESKTWRRAGRFDVVVRDLRDQLIRVMDHKASSEDISQGSEFWRRLRMDTQISGYFEGARFKGYDAISWLHDVVAKPDIRPLKATPVELRKYTKPTKKEPESRLYANQREHDETVKEFRARLTDKVAEDINAVFQRGEIVRLEGELREAMLDDWKFSIVLRGLMRDGYHPRNPDGCTRFGKTCSFFPVCTKTASLDDPGLYKKLPTTHPELVESTETL